MYNIKLSDYIPTPTPATSDRIVAAHYYGAWKKGAAGLHEGFNDLAEVFPECTPLMGYYDEENPEVCDWEIKWAVEHGINCFIHCWYRKKDNEGKPVSVSDLRCGHGLHEALFHAKFQNMIKFAIMFETSPRWGGTDKNDMVENLMPFWIENYFKRENYLCIDNKPVLFICNQDRLANECFASAEEQKQTFDACRECAKKAGFDGMLFAFDNSNLTPEVHEASMACGYDFRFGYNAGYIPPETNYTNQEDIIDSQCRLLQRQLSFAEKTFIPTPSCFSDPAPRCTDHWMSLGMNYRLAKTWYLYPEGYKELLKKMKAITDALPEDAYARKIIMIDNWNEWDEGHFVAPSHKFGYKYLQAIREVFTACDNLPDYRTPADQGFTGYNTSWKTPDFSRFCEEQLKKEKK